MPATARSVKGRGMGNGTGGERTVGAGLTGNGQGTDRERRRASRAEERRPTEGGREKAAVGG